MTMFVRKGDECVARFESGESAVLQQVLVEMVALLSDGFDRADPVVERLFPDLYLDDPAGSADLRQYTEGDLKTAKLNQAGSMLAALPDVEGDVRLSDEQAEEWLRALTDARIALGLRLEIRDDTDLEAEIDSAVLHDPTSPKVGQLSVYAYLTYLQESLLEALVSGSTPQAKGITET